MRNPNIILAMALVLQGCSGDAPSPSPDNNTVSAKPAQATPQDGAVTEADTIINSAPIVPKETIAPPQPHSDPIIKKNSFAGPAGSKQARCKITSGTESRNSTYNGSCWFLPEKGGSFSLSLSDEKAFFHGIVTVSVSMDSPDMKSGQARVRGLTEEGINSNWGSATRDQADKACWNGRDFQICAY